jgi:hypothetical protein
MSKYVVVPNDKHNPTDYGLIARALRGALVSDKQVVYSDRFVELARIHQAVGMGAPLWIRRPFIPPILITMFVWVAAWFPFRQLFFYPLSAETMGLALKVMGVVGKRRGRQ